MEPEPEPEPHPQPTLALVGDMVAWTVEEAGRESVADSNTRPWAAAVGAGCAQLTSLSLSDCWEVTDASVAPLRARGCRVSK
jgi:hypothetical protein